MRFLGNVIYWIAYIIMRIYFSIVHRWTINGKKNRPQKGSLIIMANHISAFDPPIVGTIMNRKVHFMAKEELFNIPILGRGIRAIGTFPVKRGRPDRTALREAFRLLNEKKVICIFPEGTRSKTGRLGKARAGAVFIALKSGSPILPVGIKKEEDSLKFKISIGEKFSLDQYYDEKLSREKRKEVGRIIMNKIKKELES